MIWFIVSSVAGHSAVAANGRKWLLRTAIGYPQGNICTYNLPRQGCSRGRSSLETISTCNESCRNNTGQASMGICARNNTTQRAGTDTYIHTFAHTAYPPKGLLHITLSHPPPPLLNVAGPRWRPFHTRCCMLWTPCSFFPQSDLPLSTSAIGLALALHTTTHTSTLENGTPLTSCNRGPSSKRDLSILSI